MTGIVKWFNNDLGYGFINSNNIEVFVHYSCIITKGFKSLVKGEIVEFTPIKTKSGYKAKNVKTKDTY